MAERPDRASAADAENTLRQNLRKNGLGWIVEQVDEELTQMASNQDEPPTVEVRLISLVDAVVFAFELVDGTETGTLELLAAEDLSANDKRPTFARIEFVDPLDREKPRPLDRDRESERAIVDALQDAARKLRTAFDLGSQS
jgi:hypothetical protein